MKRIIILFIMLCFFSITNVFSQQQEETIFLKDGSIIHGILIEQMSGGSLKIKTHDGNIFVYKMDDIEKISTSSEQNSIYNTRRTGLFYLWHAGIMTAGAIAGDGINESVGQSVFAVGSIVGDRINDIIRIGVGAEYNNYPNGTTVPVYVDFRINALQSRVSPIFFLDVGYSLAWINNLAGINGDGLFLSVGSGAEFGLDNGNVLFVELCYRRQWSELINSAYAYYWNGYTYDYYSYSNNTKISYGFLSIMFGYGF